MRRIGQIIGREVDTASAREARYSVPYGPPISSRTDWGSFVFARSWLPHAGVPPSQIDIERERLADREDTFMKTFAGPRHVTVWIVSAAVVVALSLLTWVVVASGNVKSLASEGTNVGNHTAGPISQSDVGGAPEIGSAINAVDPELRAASPESPSIPGGIHSNTDGTIVACDSSWGGGQIEWNASTDTDHYEVAAVWQGSDGVFRRSTWSTRSTSATNFVSHVSRTFSIEWTVTAVGPGGSASATFTEPRGPRCLSDLVR